MKLIKLLLLQFALLLVVVGVGIDLLGVLGISRQHIANTVVPNHATVATANKDLNQTCSCFNSTATKECCIRFAHRLHKFGWLLASKLFAHGDKAAHITLTTDFDHAYMIIPASAADYRQIFMARNVYKAIVSGYLYHKAGQECWKDGAHFFGRLEWVRDTSHVTLPTWASKNHTLCSYLAATSEMEGLKLYIDVVFQRYYYNIGPFLHEVQRRKEKYNEDKTLIVCMDDLSHPDKKVVKYHEVMDWIFPGGQNFTIPRDIRVKKRYRGRHATSHDPALHTRLISLIKKLDRDIFYDKIATIQGLLKCD